MGKRFRLIVTALAVATIISLFFSYFGISWVESSSFLWKRTDNVETQQNSFKVHLDWLFGDELQRLNRSEPQLDVRHQSKAFVHKSERVENNSSPVSSRIVTTNFNRRRLLNNTFQLEPSPSFFRVSLPDGRSWSSTINHVLQRICMRLEQPPIVWNTFAHDVSYLSTPNGSLPSLEPLQTHLGLSRAQYKTRLLLFQLCGDATPFLERSTISTITLFHSQSHDKESFTSKLLSGVDTPPKNFARASPPLMQANLKQHAFPVFDGQENRNNSTLLSLVQSLSVEERHSAVHIVDLASNQPIESCPHQLSFSPIQSKNAEKFYKQHPDRSRRAAMTDHHHFQNGVTDTLISTIALTLLQCSNTDRGAPWMCPELIVFALPSHSHGQGNETNFLEAFSSCLDSHLLARDIRWTVVWEPWSLNLDEQSIPETAWKASKQQSNNETKEHYHKHLFKGLEDVLVWDHLRLEHHSHRPIVIVQYSLSDDTTLNRLQQLQFPDPHLCQQRDYYLAHTHAAGFGSISFTTLIGVEVAYTFNKTFVLFGDFHAGYVDQSVCPEFSMDCYFLPHSSCGEEHAWVQVRKNLNWPAGNTSEIDKEIYGPFLPKYKEIQDVELNNTVLAPFNPIGFSYKPKKKKYSRQLKAWGVSIYDVRNGATLETYPFGELNFRLRFTMRQLLHSRLQHHLYYIKAAAFGQMPNTSKSGLTLSAKQELARQNGFGSVFACFHVRRGDKAIKERKKLPSFDRFLEKLNQFNEARSSPLLHVWLATDDKTVAAQARNISSGLSTDLNASYPYQFHMLNTFRISGQMSLHARKMRKFTNSTNVFLDLMTDVEVCARSQYFVGTYSSHMTNLINRRIHMLRGRSLTSRAGSEFAVVI